MQITVTADKFKLNGKIYAIRQHPLVTSKKYQLSLWV